MLTFVQHVFFNGTRLTLNSAIWGIRSDATKIIWMYKNRCAAIKSSSGQMSFCIQCIKELQQLYLDIVIKKISLIRTTEASKAPVYFNLKPINNHCKNTKLFFKLHNCNQGPGGPGYQLMMPKMVCFGHFNRKYA